MDATHARPMAAYAALCAAAVMVLAQGAGTSSTVSGAVAQAGKPAIAIAHSVTLTATEQFSAQVSHLATTVANTMVPAAAAQHGETGASGGSAASPRSTHREKTTARVADPVTIAPARGNLRVASSAITAQQLASVDRKTDHKADHKAERNADRKAGHKADRKAGHKADRKAGHKADRKGARDARKADHASAKQTRAAHRAQRHHR